MNRVKRKLFSLSLMGRATEWYKTLKDGRRVDWEEIVHLFYNFHPHEVESIAQAWGRLKSLMLKCPIHDLPRNIVINNFYARLSGY
jgi:hypothetical protein